MNDLQRAMEAARAALYAEFRWLRDQGFSQETAAELMRLREVYADQVAAGEL